MTQFDESKVITPLHPEKAEVGKKYWFADELVTLKEEVEKETTPYELYAVKKGYLYPFDTDITEFQFLYPYEEPPEQRMTKRQLAEWIAKGNGEYANKNTKIVHYNEYSYTATSENEKVEEDGIIRPWGSDKWVEPTVDIYIRDCKKR